MSFLEPFEKPWLILLLICLGLLIGATVNFLSIQTNSENKQSKYGLSFGLLGGSIAFGIWAAIEKHRHAK